MPFQSMLFALQDAAYADFQAKLIPNIPRERIIGVRVPRLRQLAGDLKKEEAAPFLQALPHAYYDEDLLHGMLICQIREFDCCVEALERFLPYVDNWAVCDTMSPKVLGKCKGALLEKIGQWIDDTHVYTCRFGLLCLMRYFLEEDFDPALLELPAQIRREEYYVNMMVAWFFATALAKQWTATLPYLQERRLSPWVHRKTIQKARESYRITPEQKDYLNTLK